MTNTNLLEIIRAFPAKELQEIASFLASRHFNRGKNAPEVERLFHIVLEAAPDFSEAFLTKEKVYFKLFAEKNMASGRLEKVVADLNKLLRTFALIRLYQSEDNEDLQQIDWAKWLRMHGLAEDSQKVLQKLRRKKENDVVESLDGYAIDFAIAEEQHLWESTYNKIKGNLNIPELVQRLDLHYQNYRTELVNRYMMQQKGTQLPVLNFSDIDKSSYMLESVRLQISTKIYKLLVQDFPSPEEIRTLMEDLKTYEKVLSIETLEHFNAYLRNFCTLLINGGHMDFIPVLHDINKDNLFRGYFFLNGKLSPHAYLNMIQIAIRAKDIDWAKTITEKFKNLIIEDDETQFFYYFNVAHCLFAEKRFEEALDCLPDAPSTSHYHHMVRRLELKAYYELNSDLLTYKIDAFRKFIMRTATKTIPPALQKMDLNFLNILTQIVQTPRKDKVRAERLKKRIDEKKLLADRTWLLEKVKELG